MTYVLITLLFVLSQGFFSGMETGLISLLKPRVRHGVEKGDRGAGHLLFFIRRPGILLATTLMGTNICVVCSSNMAKKAAVSFGFKSETAFLVLGCMMSLILVNAEIIPKDWFRQLPYQRCRRFAGLFRFCYYVLYLPSQILSAYTTWVNGLAGEKSGRQDASVIMRKDFTLLLRESEKAGVVDPSIAQIIDRSLYCHGLKVSDLMIRREAVAELSSDMTLREAYELCRKSRFSRMPVKRQGAAADEMKWAGIFSIYDLVFEVEESSWDRMKVSDLTRPLVEISSEEKISSVFNAARSGSSPILAISDPARGGVHSGIISLFDISGRLFGF
jgi:CBS domain containing-hemolysin-like protein